MKMLLLMTTLVLSSLLFGQDTLAHKSMFRGTLLFPWEQSYETPKEKSKWTLKDYRDNIVHITPTDLGFTESDTVTGSRILSKAKAIGLGEMCGLCDCGYLASFKWPDNKPPQGQILLFSGTEPLITVNGDKYIFASNLNGATGFFPIKLGGKDIVFPLGSDWFFIKTPKYRPSP